MSQSDEAEYREGVVLNKPVREGRGSFVNVGLPKEVEIDRHLEPGLRVTVKMKPAVEGMCSNTQAIAVLLHSVIINHVSEESSAISSFHLSSHPFVSPFVCSIITFELSGL